jgi:hypothetical protein
MDLIALIGVVRAAIEGAKGGLRLSRKALGKRKHDQLVSAAIAELLKELPDIDAAEARLKAAEATGVEPDMDLLRAQSMLSRTKLFRFREPTRDAGGAEGMSRTLWAKKRITTKKGKRRPRRVRKSRGKIRRH